MSYSNTPPEYWNARFSPFDNLADLGGGEFLVEPEGAPASYGAIARATVDPQSGTVTATAVVPMGTSRPDDIIVSADHTQALLEVDGAWYLASVGDLGAEPESLDSPSPEWADATVLGWF